MIRTVLTVNIYGKKTCQTVTYLNYSAMTTATQRYPIFNQLHKAYPQCSKNTNFQLACSPWQCDISHSNGLDAVLACVCTFYRYKRSVDVRHALCDCCIRHSLEASHQVVGQESVVFCSGVPCDLSLTVALHDYDLDSWLSQAPFQAILAILSRLSQ